MENVAAVNDGKNRHGYPRGYHFVPRKVELIRLLEHKIAGRPLPPPFPSIFHDVRILDFHPDQLYDAYKAHQEAGCIYFFSRREFPTPRGDRGRPVRVTKDGGNWKASGGGKLVSTMKRGGINIGYELTMVFYDRKKPGDDKSSGKTDWGMHEYTRIMGPDKKVADMALYRLYKKKTKQAGHQHVATSSDGPLKLEELPSPDSTASTSQAQAQAGVWQSHDYYHQDSFGAPAPVPGPSSWPAPAVNPLGQVHAGCMELTGLMVPSLQANTVNHTPASSPPQQALSLQPTAAPMSPQQQAVNHLDDEFKAWCEMQQQEQPAASPGWFPMSGDEYLPMLLDGENDHFACTMDELLAGLRDEADRPIQEPDANHEVKSSKSNR